MASNRLAWLGGAALGAVALARALTRRPPPAPVYAPPPPPEDEPSGPDPRAEELRAKLADARELADERDEFEGAETPVDEAEPSGPDPRAEELRAKLADARELADERDEFEGAETPVDEADPVSDPEARRRSVHESGRAAADRMRSSRPD